MICLSHHLFCSCFSQCSTIISESSSTPVGLLGDGHSDAMATSAPVQLRVLVVSHGGWIRSLLEHILVKNLIVQYYSY